MEPTKQDYLSAAQIIATCPADRIGIVLELLKSGGYDVAQLDVPPPVRHEPKQPRSTVTRIDMESAELLAMLRKQTGLTMIMLASSLIKEGYKTFDSEREE